MFYLLMLKAYIKAHRVDFICLSEAYLDSTIEWDNKNLEIPRYNLVCSDHPSNNKGDRFACVTKHRCLLK